MTVNFSPTQLADITTRYQAGACECGCGGMAPISRENRPSRGYVRGEPMRFIKGHSSQKRSVKALTDLLGDWREVPGYPGYEVTPDGLVRSPKGNVLKPQLDGGHPPNQYLAVHCVVDGRFKRLFVHRAILLAFIGEPAQGEICRHLDGNHLNNALSNLAWGTHSENMYDRVRHGTDPNASKTHCINGHEFTPENTRWGRGGRARTCRTCAREWMRAKRAEGRVA